MDLDVTEVDCCKPYYRIHWRENDHECCLEEIQTRYVDTCSVIL